MIAEGTKTYRLHSRTDHPSAHGIYCVNNSGQGHRNHGSIVLSQCRRLKERVIMSRVAEKREIVIGEEDVGYLRTALNMK